ncbi:MAG: DUF2955 domain-containing protein [Nitrococcus sp.]|nr:DUF2955 domain-containing protein [Nitrococcus sp.]
MMAIGAKRTFRLSSVVALSLAFAYGLGLPLPFLAPLFAILLTAAPAPPMRLRGLLGLILVVMITSGVGLLLIPILTEYPLSAVLVIAAGIYLSTLVTVGLGKGLIGTFLAIGFTLIPAAGLVGYSLAVAVIKALLLGIALAIVCHWIVYPLYPEEAIRESRVRSPTVGGGSAYWIALRATLIILPPVLMAFSNPSLYLQTIMKTVLLAQQGSVVSVRAAGRELLGSTFLAGCFAILFWFALKIWPSLWMFFLWMLLFGIYYAGKLYGVIASRFTPSFWQNVVVTMLILLGPAVQDSVAGKDVYKAFAVRFSLFVAVTLYAWITVVALERLRARRHDRMGALQATVETR